MIRRIAAAMATAAVIAAVLLAVTPARGELVPCSERAHGARIADALDRLRRTVDPCGQSGEIVRVLAVVERCPTARYEICTTDGALRNVFDRSERRQTGTIMWNPSLRTVLEDVCEETAAGPVRRDPTASLLHELVHAAHDCEGLRPGADELEAVRIENIYRRGAGLCQRVGYGVDRLPSAAWKPCSAGQCACGGPEPVRLVPREDPERSIMPAKQSADAAVSGVDARAPAGR